jgi:hypothetical protein
MLKIELAGGVTGREFPPLAGCKKALGFDCCYWDRNGLLDTCLDMPRVAGGSDALLWPASDFGDKGFCCVTRAGGAGWVKRLPYLLSTGLLKLTLISGFFSSSGFLFSWVLVGSLKDSS